MKIKNINITNLRGLDHINIDFQPGMNLLVGVNGVGKTTVLDALRIFLSNIMPFITSSRSRELSFLTDDISIGKDFMTATLSFQLASKEYQFRLQKYRQAYSLLDKDKATEEMITNKNSRGIESLKDELDSKLKESEIQPIALYFSTKRSSVSEAGARASNTESGQVAAYASALINNRELSIRSIADWMKVQQDLAQELPRVRRHLELMSQVACSFLPEISQLEVKQQEVRRTTSGKPIFGTQNIMYVSKGEKKIEIAQLSDGERSMLALALEITRRLSQANPGLDDPCKEGEGVILIDELDLHLHPKWQRTIVENLTKTFPQCQFIATTHSPQIIPSVQPENVLIMKSGKVDAASQTLGMDSNWILKFIMETDDRPHEAVEAIRKVESLIFEGKFTQAREVISEYKKNELDLSEWVIFEARMARMEILKNQSK